METRSEQQLEGFADWIRKRRLVPESPVRYLIGWVDRFRRLQRRRPRESWEDTLQVFLGDLEAGQTPAWQLRQAADAVTLYCGQFCVPEHTPVCAGGDSDTCVPGPQEARREIPRLMQLRH